MKKKKATILIVDDHPVVALGIEKLLEQRNDFRTQKAEDGTQMFRSIEASMPDLVLLDISLPGVHGIELLKQIRAQYPKLPVLMLSMHDESLYAVRSLRCGANGYVMKHAVPETLLSAIDMVLDGGLYLSPQMEKRMSNQFRPTSRPPSPLENLSDRELEVFALYGEGKTTRQIAEVLHLSIKTIESHRAHIKEKLNLKNSTELLQLAMRWRGE